MGVVVAILRFWLCAPRFRSLNSGLTESAISAAGGTLILQRALTTGPRLEDVDLPYSFTTTHYTTMVLPLTFLRPLALPRASAIRYFLSASHLSTTTTTSSTTPAITTPQSSPSSAASAPSLAASSPFASSSSSSSPTSAAKQPYNIIRTPSNNLPIYLLAKRGGNLKQTRLRKIEGDVGALRSDLQQALGLEEKECVINRVTSHIVIKVCTRGHPAFILFREYGEDGTGQPGVCHEEGLGTDGVIWVVAWGFLRTRVRS